MGGAGEDFCFFGHFVASVGLGGGDILRNTIDLIYTVMCDLSILYYCIGFGYGWGKRGAAKALYPQITLIYTDLGNRKLKTAKGFLTQRT